jgi:putative FmdB family regulatory protein
MPIYEYRCEACGHQEEFLQRVSEPTLTDCPACHKPTFRKLPSAAGFHLKGSGWYATDFTNKTACREKGRGQVRGQDRNQDGYQDRNETREENREENRVQVRGRRLSPHA